MARRVQEIVREGSQRTLSGLRPIEIARGMAAQPLHLLNLLHVGAFIGAARNPKPSLVTAAHAADTSLPHLSQVPAVWKLGWFMHRFQQIENVHNNMSTAADRRPGHARVDSVAQVLLEPDPTKRCGSPACSCSKSGWCTEPGRVHGRGAALRAVAQLPTSCVVASSELAYKR